MEAAKSHRSSLALRLSVTCALVALMLAAVLQQWPRVRFWQKHRLAEHLIVRLESSTGPNIHRVLKQVSRLGDPGIEALVRAAASERADIAFAARQIIDEQFTAWKVRHATHKSSLMAKPIGLLAAALSSHAEEFGPFGQQWATRLTLEVVDIAGSFDVEHSLPILADCSAVLAKVPALGPRMLTPSQPAEVERQERVAAGPPEVRVPPIHSSMFMHESTDQNKPVSGRIPPTMASATNSSHRQELGGDGTPASNSDWVPEWLSKPSQANVKAESLNADLLAQPVTPGELIEVPSPDDLDKLTESLRLHSSRELLIQLKEAGQFTAAAIRSILATRGIYEAELEVATKVVAEDAAERMALIDDLRVLPARTARRWIRELLSDEDPEVRLKALTALATTNDPELNSIARDIAIRDKDRRVAELASRILRDNR